MKTDLYKNEITDPGDQLSRIAHQVCVDSFQNCPALTVAALQPGNFRGQVVRLWRKPILEQMLQYATRDSQVISWTMAESDQSDGAGGKPQFFTLVGTPEVMKGLGWEIITMNADDFSRFGMLPCIMSNNMDVKLATAQNLHLAEAVFSGYGEALRASNLVNITGETAIMKHSVTAFCDTGQPSQLILNWGGSCVGLAHSGLRVDPSRIAPGMAIVGFQEAGYRCNGGTFFTNLIRDVWGPRIESILESAAAMDFARQLCVPSVSYSKTVSRLLGWKANGDVTQSLANISGIAHITGGGLWGKFGEILPAGVGAVLDKMPDPPSVLLHGQELSRGLPIELSDWRGYSTLHGGCGMLLVCDPNDADTIVEEARQDQVVAGIVGKTVPSDDREILITSRFAERGKILSSLRPE